MIKIYKDEKAQETAKETTTFLGQPKTAELQDVELFTINRLGKQLLERDKKAIGIVITKVEFRFIY